MLWILDICWVKEREKWGMRRHTCAQCANTVRSELRMQAIEAHAVHMMLSIYLCYSKDLLLNIAAFRAGVAD
jgi:hypothetical protein